MPNKRITTEEHERRLNLYSPYKSYAQMGKEMFLSPKGVEAWITRSNLRQPYGVKQKLVISPSISIWEYRDGTVGKRIKRRTYVRYRPMHERNLVRDFIATYIELNKRKKISITEVMKTFRKEARLQGGAE